MDIRRWGATVLVIALFSGPVYAQRVQPQSVASYGANLAQFSAAAHHWGLRDWPNPATGLPGTRVQITFDAQNADVTLVTAHDYGLDRLLAAAKGIAAASGYPRADYYTLNGTHTAGVDIELNKYLSHGHRRTDFALRVGALARALESSPLPHPIVVGADLNSNSSSTLDNAGQRRVLNGWWFASPGAIDSGAVLATRCEITRAGLLPGLLMLLLIGYLPCAPWHLLQMRLKNARVVAAPPVPEEAQRRYDRSRPVLFLFFAATALMPLLVLHVNPEQAMSALQLLLPVPLQTVMFGAFGLTFVSFALSHWIWTRLNKEKSRTSRDEEVSATGVPGGRLLLLFLIPMVLMPMLLFVPIYSTQGLLWRRDAVFAMIGLFIVGVPAVLYLQSRRHREVLTDGPWYDMVVALAESTGVPVKRVVLVRSGVPNAYASVFGTVGLTQKLLDELPPDEVRAIIAHELAHLRQKHPQLALALGTGIVVVLLALWFEIQHLLHGIVPEHALLIAGNSATVAVLGHLLAALLVGPLHRKQEREADRLAVEWTGDPELMIRALTHLNTLLRNTTQLRTSDELLATHPSLARRLEAIRSGA